MKRINVIKDNAEFSVVMNNGFYRKDKNFIIYSLKNNLNKVRFGISVPTKLGKAHIRNYYKRVVRQICDNNKTYYSNDKDYVIIIRKGSLDSSYQELENSFRTLMDYIEKEIRYEKR